MPPSIIEQSSGTFSSNFLPGRGLWEQLNHEKFSSIFVQLQNNTKKLNRSNAGRVMSKSSIKDEVRFNVPWPRSKGFGSDQKSIINDGSIEREFTIGEQVLVQNFRGEPK